MKQVFLITILTFLFSISMSAQVKVSESDTDDFKMIKDEDMREKVAKNWKSAYRSSKSNKMNVIAETDKTIVLSIVNKAVYYYAFDKETMKLKHIRYNKVKNFSVTNTYLRFPKILNNGDVVYLYEVNEKLDSREVTSTFAYAINDGEMIALKETKKVYKDMRQEAIKEQSIISSNNEKYFGFLKSDDGKNAEIIVYNEKFELQYETKVELPKVEEKKSLSSKFFSGLTGLGNGLQYSTIISNDGQELYFYRINKYEKENTLTLEVRAYNQKTKKLKKSLKRFEDLGILIADNGKERPSYIFRFEGDDLFIAGTSPSKINREGKYKRQDSYFVAHHLSFPELKVKKSVEVELTDDLYEQLDEIEKKRFDRKVSQVSDIQLYFNADKTEIKAVSVSYTTVKSTHSANGTSSNSYTPAGTIYFPIEGTKNSKKPVAQKSSEVAKGQRGFVFSTGNKTYRLQNKSSKTFIYEIQGETEKLLYEYEHENNVYLWNNEGFTEDYIIFRTSTGLVKYEFE